MCARDDLILQQFIPVNAAWDSPGVKSSVVRGCIIGDVRLLLVYDMCVSVRCTCADTPVLGAVIHLHVPAPEWLPCTYSRQVPDRGGRPNERRAGPMPQWRARSADPAASSRLLSSNFPPKHLNSLKLAVR
jgi:hypothetical protein